MSWWSRLLGRRYRLVEDFEAVGTGRVELRGFVEAEDVLHDPLTGQPCIAIEYRAWPLSTTIGLDGASAQTSRAFKIEAHQAVDFVLSDGLRRVLVHAAGGDDIDALHGELLQRYGVQLRAETVLLEPGAAVGLTGTVEASRGTGSPLRNDPYAATIRVHRVWRV